MTGFPTQLAIEFELNGTSVRTRVTGSERLLDVLRNHLGHTAAKDACGEGECGACTVLLDGAPVLACLVPAFQVRQRVVETAEGQVVDSLLPLLHSGASQCGACSPGVTMTATWLRRHPEVLARFPLRELLAGNLCRCTGYDGIVDGVQSALDEDAAECS
jgi:aerobic-type carbon monoxide dehydrogenase small subunit (CoxS/CutS family)